MMLFSVTSAMFITSRPIYSKEIAISSYNITLFHNKQKRKNFRNRRQAGNEGAKAALFRTCGFAYRRSGLFVSFGAEHTGRITPIP